MIRMMTLQRPLVILDLETTGTALSDRIVQIAIRRLEPPDGRSAHTWSMLVDPGCPIPAEAIAIHGITDDRVRGAARFCGVGQEILQRIEGCDIAGYNITRFDLPLLAAEMERCGLALDMTQRVVIDAYDIWCRQEPRTLDGALNYYCGRQHTGAHDAAADVEATEDVLRAQISQYEELPADVPALGAALRDPDAVDMTGKLRRENGHVVLAFGKYKGKCIKNLVKEDPSYLRWILGGDFPSDVKALLREALG